MAVMMRQMSAKSITLEQAPLEYERKVHERRISQQQIQQQRAIGSVDSTMSEKQASCCFNDPFWKVKALYAFPQLSLLSLTMLINIHVIIFYNEVGVRLSFLSFFQIFSRSFDVLTDPMMAHVSDNLTRTRWGRRKPWISLGAPMYAVAFFFLMSPPGDAGDGKTMNLAATWWFGASYLIFYLSDTLANIPLFALGPELSDDPEARNGLFMWSKVFEGIGTMTGGALPVVLLTFFAKKDAFRMMAGGFGAWYLLTIAALLFTVSERPGSITSRGLPFVPAIFRAFSNPAFRVLAVSWILDYSGLAIFVGVMPFWFNYYVLEGKELGDRTFSLAVTVLFLAGFFSIPVWRMIAMQPDPDFPSWNDRLKIGARNAWLLYNLVNALSNFLFVFIQPGKSSIPLIFVFSILNGLPVGGQFLMLSMLANVVDYDEFLNHSRQEGTFVVLSTFVPKMAAIPAQSLPLVILYSLGFIDPKTVNGQTKIEPQNDRIRLFLRIMFAVVPAVLATLSWFIKRTFPIKSYEIMRGISDGIQLHAKGVPAIDPITGETVPVIDWSEEELEDLDLLNHFTPNEKRCIIEDGNTERVKCRVVSWIGFMSCLLAVCCAGVIVTWPLLNSQRWAIVPALFCVGIGGSAAAVALNILRYKAAKTLRIRMGYRRKEVLRTLHKYQHPQSSEKASDTDEGLPPTMEGSSETYTDDGNHTTDHMTRSL